MANELVNKTIVVDWLDDEPVEVTVNSVLKPYVVGEHTVHVVTIDISDEVLNKLSNTPIVQAFKTVKESHIKNMYGLCLGNNLITYYCLAEELIGITDKDATATLYNDIKTVCPDTTMLKPVYIPDKVYGYEDIILFMTDFSNLEGEMNEQKNPMASQMIEMLKKHVHVSKFMEGLFNTLFNRYNIENMPSARDIAQMIMQGQYIDKDGKKQSMTIKDVDVLLEDIKSHIRISRPDAMW